MLSNVEEALGRPLTENAKSAQKARPTSARARRAGVGGAPWTDKILDQAWKIILAIVAAIGGVTGFVGLTGSAFLWERFDQAGIPAEQALGKVPASQAAIFGAEAIIVAVLLAIGAVVLVWAFDSKATVSVISVISVVLLVAIGVLFAILQNLSWYWIVTAAAVGLVLALAALVVADRTRGEFVPFAAAVVVATGIFNLLLFFLTTEEHVPVTPAAVVQPDGSSFKGYYVADGSETIYLAIPTGQANDVILREIPRTEDTDLGIGHTVDRDDAGPKLDEALMQLQEQPARKPPEQ